MLEKIIRQSKVDSFTLRDGVRMSYRTWGGRHEKAAIIYLHGLESHMGWFGETGDRLNRKGFQVYALDRRGSGASEGERGHMESFRVLVSDLHEFVKMVKDRYPQRKIYLMALCWGAKLAAVFSAYYQGLVDGLILFAPGIKTKVGLSLKGKFDVALSNIFKPRKLFDAPLKDCMFTRDPKYLEFIKKDPLKITKLTARFLFETGKMDRLLGRIAPKINLPTLVLLAGDDAIVDNRGVKKWVARMGSRDKDVKLYSGCAHSLEFEKEIGGIVDCLTEWINGRQG